MNILYFITHITNSGGMEHIVIDKINYFVEHGYNISLAYFGNKADISFFPNFGEGEMYSYMCFRGYGIIYS